MAVMTDNAIEIVTAPIEGDWLCSSQYNADVTGCEDLLAAVTGKNHYIRLIRATSTSATATLSFGADQNVGGTGLAHTYIGPVTAYVQFIFDLNDDNRAIKLPVGHTFSVDGVTAAAVWIYFEYKTI